MMAHTHRFLLRWMLVIKTRKVKIIIIVSR